MSVRMDLAELDLDEMEARADEDRLWTKEQLAVLTTRMTSLTRSNWALVIAVITALIAVIGALIGTR